MSVVSKPSIAFHRKRLAAALAAVSLCMLLGACGNDDKTPDAHAVSSTERSAGEGDAAAVLSANPSAASPAPAAVTIQTPARPASGADAALSAAASTPLATPVIHTVD